MFHCGNETFGGLGCGGEQMKRVSLFFLQKKLESFKKVAKVKEMGTQLYNNVTNNYQKQFLE